MLPMGVPASTSNPFVAALSTRAVFPISRHRREHAHPRHYDGRVIEPDQPRLNTDETAEPASSNWVRVDPADLAVATPPPVSADETDQSDGAVGDGFFTPVPPIDPERLQANASSQHPSAGAGGLGAIMNRLRATTRGAPGLSTIDRLRDGQRALSDRILGWSVTVIITGLAFALRVYNLATPNRLIFDETYYAKDAWTLWNFGYETSWPSNDVDAKVAAGNPDLYLSDPAFVVHPPLGKWLIGLGEQVFGMNAFGWRIMSVVFGTLLVFMTIRMARRLSRSTLIGAIAGILLTVDGLAFVMSRVALLDIFQAFFLVAAVAALIADRDWYRGKLADIVDRTSAFDFGGRFGPMVWWRPWRLVAGAMFGLAISVKWNSVVALAALGVLAVVWDIGARRLAGSGTRRWFALIADGLPAFVQLVVLSAVIYVASWWGWLSTSGGYDRNWGLQHPDDPLVKLLGKALGSLVHYHQEVYAFHTGEFIRSQTHPYDANPLGWLLMIRPIGMDANGPYSAGTAGCTAVKDQTCTQVISGAGTPLLWWMAFAALIVGLVWWIAARDWRFGAPIVAGMSTYLFWFPNADRPVFFFYAICIIPFTVTILAMVMGLILGPAGGPNRRRGAIIVGVAVALVIANFAFIYPILTDGMLTTEQYAWRIWLPTWQ